MAGSVVFVCTECGRQVMKWMGRCPGCGEWNTVVERDTNRVGPSPAGRAMDLDDRPGGVLPVTQVSAEPVRRLSTGIEELDRVLGGGVVPRSVILVGGDPGIGKSTLLMQALGALEMTGERVLYISGEESSEQLKLRAERLGVRGDGFLVLMENELETILGYMEESEVSVIVIDSVQSIFSSSVESTAGSVSQVRHVASRVVDLVKRGRSACFVVGHVTKGGDLAGPKLMEHMVDTVLYFEGERSHPYRILRATKNRFGSASEIGVFEMGDAGLRQVANPSELFLSERPRDVSGSVVTSLVEGSRAILAEIQALVTGPAPGQGRRTCLGTDPQRLALMVAVLEKKLGLGLGDQDIFLNAVGGVRALEPATDLAVATALLSSFTDRTIPAGTVVFGEVGLAGEVRRVYRADARINEAARLGFERIILPGSDGVTSHAASGVTTLGVSHVRELAQAVFDE